MQPVAQRIQSSLFDEPTSNLCETIQEINAELLVRARSMPEFADRVFIFGEGPQGARVALVGESPGPPDVASGKPFNGPTGEMLDRILNSIGLQRRNCYLTNTVKFNSSGQELTPELSSFFTPYLHRELAVIRPEIVIALGNTPARALLATKKAISQLRGEFYDYQQIRMMPTFNPAYLLRDPSKKREVWEDLKKVRSFLASPASQR